MAGATLHIRPARERPAVCRGAERRLRRARAAVWAVLALAAAAGAAPLAAAVLDVGDGHPYPTPSAAARAAADGDLVIIHSGIYRADYATWTQDSLTVFGEGTVRLVAGEEPIPNGKAIWVVRGRDVHIENIAFENARVKSLNGAGIRQEDGTLTIENCRFRGNEMGILVANRPQIALTIKGSVFDANTQDYARTGRLGHNVYVGRIGRFELIDSEIRGAATGHNVKTRAAVSRIKNNHIHDTPGQFASYQIDIPDGGDALVEGNLIRQGEKPENYRMVSFGAEGRVHDTNRLVVRNNRFVSAFEESVAIFNHYADVAPVIEGNSFDGVAVTYGGAGEELAAEATP